jgi:hypothetical protein
MTTRNTGDAPNDLAALLADLRADAESIPALLHALQPEQLQQGAYEQGWAVRDLVAHLASIEWTYPRLLQQAAQPASSSSSGSDGKGSGMDAYNARQVEKRRETPIADLIAEFSANRQATIDAVAAADPALLATTIQSYGGASGSLVEVLRFVAIEHVRGHLRDIEAAR